MKKRKFVIGGLAIFMAIGFLGFLGFRGGATYYYEVGELLARGSAVYGQTVRVNGQVAPGSVQQAGLSLEFTVVDGKGASLPTTYQGVVPDTFKPGGDIVVEGKLEPGGVFQATTLMPKCPSRYEA